MAPEIRAIIITVSGQLLVVRCNYGARGLLQLDLIPCLICYGLEVSRVQIGPGISTDLGAVRPGDIRKESRLLPK